MAKVFSKNRKIAISAILCAIVVVLGLPPAHLGMITLGKNASITIMHLPVILAVILIALYEKKFDLSSLASGLIASLAFGISSLILAHIQPVGSLDPLFVNPGVSILPRILLAFLTWILWNMISSFSIIPNYVNAAITAFISTIAHTAIVIASLYIFASEKTFRSLGNSNYSTTMSRLFPNLMIEALIAAIICAIVVLVISSKENRKSKLSRGK